MGSFTNLLKTLTILGYWNSIQVNSEDNMRCGECGLFGCIHVHPNRKLFLDDSIPLGEDIGEVMAATNNEKGKSTVTTTLPMGPTEESNRVLIPPPPPVPAVATVGAGQGLGGVNRDLQRLDISDKTEFVRCNQCRAKVKIDYLDQHLKVHIVNFTPQRTTSNSTAIVRSSGSTSTNTTAFSTTTSTTTSTTKPTFDPDNPKLDAIEKYRFRILDQACMASSVSRNGRYSDITLVFWEREKTVANVQTYAGSTTYASKDWERFQVHIVYDSLENYYTVSCKLLKRSGNGYSGWDSEDVIPDRICSQEELGSEIKRAMLFFRISPKIAYRHFRKLFREDIVVHYDKEGRAIMASSKNCEALMARLNKKTTSDHHGDYTAFV